MRLRKLSLLALPLVAAGVAACGGGDDDAATTAAATSAAAPATSAAAATDAATDAAAAETTAAAPPESTAAAAGGTAELTFLAEDVPAGLDGDGPSAAIPTSQAGIVNLAEPLVYYKVKGPNEEGVNLLDFGFSDANFEGRLAESWTFDEASLTWTFKLRQGVVGCGGATFNADDVIYSFARAKSNSGQAPIGAFLANVASIDAFAEAFAEGPRELGDAVVKVDDYTVTIKQAAPNKLLLPVLTIFGLGIYDKETMESKATADDPWSHTYNNNENFPSFGPYCLEKWDKDREFILAANPDYYGGAPNVARVTWRKVPQSANRVAAIQTGDAQLVQSLTPREYDALRKIDSVKVQGTLGNNSLFVHMNFKSPPFDNPKVRQAMAYAINYDQIIATGYFGQASKWLSHVPSLYPGYAQPTTQYTYDPEKAKALLAESGAQIPGDILLSYVAEKESTLGPIATQIKSDLAAVGINVQLDPLPQTQYGDRQLVKKDLAFALNDQEKPIGVDAGYAMLLFFVSTEAGGLNNMVNYSSPVIDEAYKAVVNEADDATRNAKLAEMQETLMQDVAWLPVVEYKTQWAMAQNVQGLTWHPDNGVRFKDLTVG